MDELAKYQHGRCWILGAREAVCGWEAQANTVGGGGQKRVIVAKCR